jgi:hypothetical protein
MRIGITRSAGVALVGLTLGCIDVGAIPPPHDGQGGAGTGAVAGAAAGAGRAAGGATAGAGGASGGVAAGADGGADTPDEAGNDVGTSVPSADAAAGLGFGGSDITTVEKTKGCGVDATGLTRGVLVGPMHISTMGTKAANCADSKCGPWTDTRDYWIQLPIGYDANRAYPLVFEGPGCGGQGNNLYALPDFASAVIRVGLSPSAYWQAYHPTQPHQGCFDDSDGDNSVEWPFFENLYDQLAGQLCFDRNRVFASGQFDTGGRLADELACKYAGDATRPIRGVMSNAGDWSTDPRFIPTCTGKPMAGMWVHNIGDPVKPWASTKLAIARAMRVNGCTLGTGYDDATLDNFPIGGGNPDTTCQRIAGCPDVAPLVVCLLPGNYHSGNDSVVNPGRPTFINLFENNPLLTP